MGSTPAGAAGPVRHPHAATSPLIVIYRFVVPLATALAAACSSAAGSAASHEPAPATGDSAVVAALDAEYQDAVKMNDATTMARILADDFVLVTGRGSTFSKEDLLREARNATTIYERQDVETRTVRVWGNTAVVTALLWIKGIRDGRPIDYRLWFSDTYVRTPRGWRYVLGQASLPLPASP
ncbi:MAG TPA: nuclear transport factor 2 family protein [Gemmatimonadales bacterium]|nr:nuclear transport factor 2 family protein [Gemmatimonadales bacterium]